MANSLTIPMPNFRDLGPKMRALTEKQRAFVVAWFFHGGNATKAAESASYGGEKATEGSIRVQAHDVLHNPRVQEAINEYAVAITKTEQLVLASSAITDMLQDPGIEAGVRAKLALAMYDRNGLHAKTEHQVTVVDETREQTIRSIMKLAKEQGLDPRTLIGGAVDFLPEDAKLVDAEVVTVEPASSDEGLEGLI